MSQSTETRPTGKEVVSRALSAVLRGFYLLGAGDYKPAVLASTGRLVDTPFTHGGGCDCWGLAAFALKRRRHNPGFNRGQRVLCTITDDENTDSAIEDALHGGDTSTYVVVPRGEERAGDLLVYHSIYLDPVTKVCSLDQKPGWKMVKMGHVAVIERVGTRTVLAHLNDGTCQNTEIPDWRAPTTRIVQCFGPNGRTPGVMSTGPETFTGHDHEWAYFPGNPKRPDLATVVLRVRGQEP